MNSEELELSLRTEFESYLKDVVAAMRHDVADFQKNFEAEFEKHKSQMDDAFRNLSARFESDPKFDQAFTESVVEHLRLARDDGAQLTAQAFTEAQELQEKTAVPAQYDRIRDAISEITSQTSQAAILKSLVERVSQFTSRGAFFIVKHESFVCWRKFDRSGYVEDESVREIHFPSTADTLVADAVQSLSTRDSAMASHAEDSVYLDALGFGRPERMYAVPLIARGRGVAVLYADRGQESEGVNLEAIESLVRVAGLTVELRAASAVAAQPAADAPTYVPMPQSAEEPVREEEAAVSEESYDAAPAESAAEVSDSYREEPASEEVEASFDAPESVEEEYTGAVAVDEPAYTEATQMSDAPAEVEQVEEVGYYAPSAVEEEVEPSIAQEEVSYGDFEASEPSPAETVNDFAFASSDAYDASAEVAAEPEPVEEYAYQSEVNNGVNGHASYEAVAEPVVEVAAAQPVKSRLSDRHVDLPIEVSDDERRLHNDARRFARLLVSEIKLYNEQKVNEGRDSSDLYDRLREAIDRSREMYDKRVQPQVAAKFDYFHYELVSNLAEGSDAKLGASYPGAAV